MHESVDINYLSITGMCCWLIVIGCNHIFREFSILPKYTSATLLQKQLGWSLAKDLHTTPLLPVMECCIQACIGIGAQHCSLAHEELTVRTLFFTPAGLCAHQCCFLTLVSIYIV